MVLRGAVLVRIIGHASEGRPSHAGAEGHGADAPRSPQQELAAALSAPGPRPGRELCRLVRGGGLLSWLVLAFGLTLAAGSAVLEGLLLRGVLDLGRSLSLVEQRLLAVVCFLGFGLVLLVLELRVAGGLVRLGRRLEVRLRAAFLEKLPRLHDRYLQSRPISDMAERSHALHQLRLLPSLAGQFLRATFTLGLTVAVIAWIDPVSAVPAAAAAVLAVAVPLALLPLLQGLELRVRHPRRRPGPFLPGRPAGPDRGARPRGRTDGPPRTRKPPGRVGPGQPAAAPLGRAAGGGAVHHRVRPGRLAPLPERRARRRGRWCAPAGLLGPEPSRCWERKSAGSSASTRSCAT